MSAAIRWYLAVQFLAMATYVVIGPACRRLGDSGYCLSKALGVLLCGTLLWSGTAVGVLRNEPGGAWLAALTVAAAAAWLTRRRQQDFTIGSWLELLPERRVAVVCELLFGAAFIGWCLVRANDPAVSHTEQPMDLMLLTATANAATFPPHDPWLSGYPISYYYFGYWLLNTLAQLSAVVPQVAYNVGQASWFALLMVTCFGLAYNLARAAQNSDRSHRTGLIAGLLAAIIVALTANLSLPLELVRNWTSASPGAMFSEAWWWWRSSRVVQDISLAGQPIEVITEFPFFSYLLGDNHPHVLAMPFVALVLTLALNLLLDDGSGHSRERRTRQVLTGTGVAMLIPLNTWDVPGVLLVVAFVMVLRTQSQATRRLSIGTLARGAAMWALSGAVLVLPFLITAQSQVDGVLPNLFHPTSLSQFALAFGTLLPGVLIAILIGAADGRPSIRAVAAFALVGFTLPAAWLLASGVWTTQFEGGRRWVAEVAPGIAAPLRAAGDRWLAGWPVAAIGIIAIATMGALLRSRSRAGRSNDGSAFLLVLAIVGLLVSLVPEFVYADDAFSNRMNTVFKMYYQAWLLLAVVSAVAIAVALGRAWHLRTMACVALSVLAFGCVYPPIAAWHKVSAVELGGPTLDSMRYLEYFRPDEHAAIAWVQQNTQATAVIAQAAGQSYQADAGLISVATGRPTLLGWQGHESQWRGAQYGTMAAGRAEALASIYNPRSDGDLTATLSAWDVDFVLLSPRERSVYAVTAEHEARLDRVMEIGFARGAVRIYRRRG